MAAKKKQDQVDNEHAKIKAALAEMGEGKTLKECVAKQQLAYMVAWHSIHGDDDLSELYARARESYAHAKVQQIHEVAETEPDVQRARLKCDNIKWEAAKVLPKVFGDKLDINHGGNINTATDAQIEARLSALLAKAHKDSAKKQESE